MQIGPYSLSGRLILAPMAGVTDRPFRSLCRRHGASLAVSEMVSSHPGLQSDRKTLLRCDHDGEPEPRAIQILGADPRAMAEAARLNVERGAQIIDINMGCPAKKVCSVAAGSALLRDEALVGRILDAVVGAVDVPVTLKIRTGWDPSRRNAVAIARLAERCGIQALTVHGRTRACGFTGQAEYITIREVKAAVGIPVIANGDIDTPAKAHRVLRETGADALMIGRAALGNPWLFQRVAAFLQRGERLPPPSRDEVSAVMLRHIAELHAFYGEYAGVRIARKHIGWFAAQAGSDPNRLKAIHAAENAETQLRLSAGLFDLQPREMAA
jgi:tRNA-dihydrouridine synthase B